MATAMEAPASVVRPMSQGQPRRRRDSTAEAMRAMLRKTASTKESKERNREEDRHLLVQLLLYAGDGSLVRGWRRELDKEGNMEIGFVDFTKAAARLQFFGDLQLLLGKDGDLDNLTLDELAPWEGQVLDDFKEWIQETFGSPIEMFMVFAGSETAELSERRFKEACEEHDCDQSEEELRVLWECIDVSASGSVKREDVLFLEANPETRAQLLYQEKLGKMLEWKRRTSEEFIAHLQERERQKKENAKIHQAHRLAPRPWMEKYFESMPTVACSTKNMRFREAFKRQRLARIAFKEHVCKMYGNECRAVRRSLAQDGGHSFTKQMLRSYLTRHSCKIDARDLFNAMDKDEDGVVRLEDFCVHNALAIGAFLNWARHHPRLGSCAALWEAPEFGAASRELTGTWFPGKPSTVSVVEKALRSLGCPILQDAQMRRRLWGALDLHGFGVLHRSDMEWLDRWRPVEWICAEPDFEALDQLKQLFLKTFGHLLRAWRCALDRDDSNTVTWTEFRDACKRIKFNGNILGAWRALDAKYMGQVSMKEYDNESFQLLRSFKDWTELHFGSISHCFSALDEDCSGTVSFVELKRACKKFHWMGGDCRTLFDCLDVDGALDDLGHRSISREELQFLDTWVIEPTEEELAAEDEPKVQPPRPVSRTVAAISDRLASPVGGLDLREPRQPRPEPVTVQELLLRPTTPDLLGRSGGMWSSASAGTLAGSSRIPPRSPYLSPLEKRPARRSRKRGCFSSQSLQHLRAH
eukprot:TRINITY_DN14208_c0_g1_i1.p1 TRINITY_DN14208_c0_g1~~TRINITY_DN14208_c0_g1_i1.p1  ORF type:complete len:754 (+),score=169.28 TRINITY_DN14208_c0_g1_i1:99-2360(+)